MKVLLISPKIPDTLWLFSSVLRFIGKSCLSPAWHFNCCRPAARNMGNAPTIPEYHLALPLS